MPSPVHYRRRAVPFLVALVATTALGATDASGTAPSRAEPHAGAAAHSREPSSARGPEVKRKGNQRVPVNPADAPPIPLGKQAKDAVRGAKTVTEKNCYGPGQAGYQANCQNPGFTGNPNHHWANEPYFNSNRRYVWVVDELGPSREREWLQFTVNAFNSVASGNRPYFLYVTGEQLGWSGCQQNQRQVIVVCYQGGQTSSATSSYEPGSGHLLQSAIRIGNTARFTNDYYIEYSVAHEFGHAVGFAHDTNCASVMTYCSTVGRQYLWYGNDQATVFASLYDRHTS